jgi:enolase
MLAPVGITTIKQQVEAAVVCVVKLKELLESKGYSTAMGDEGGFAPSLQSNDEALELLVETIASGDFTDKIKLALDVAASSFFKEGNYTLKTNGVSEVVSQEDMLEWYRLAVEHYPIISIEDGFAEDDFDGFAQMVKELGSAICVVGDDLTVTNTARIALAAEKAAVNACIIKPNQVGTVTESVEAVQAARKLGWKVFASHRSGETMDTFIADFAAGLSCDFIKAGAPTKPERIAKYARLIEIEQELSI